MTQAERDAVEALDWLLGLHDLQPKGQDGEDQWLLAWSAARSTLRRIAMERGQVQ